jgi:hypothetical protein
MTVDVLFFSASGARICESASLPTDVRNAWFHVSFVADQDSQSYYLLVNGEGFSRTSAGQRLFWWFCSFAGVALCQGSLDTWFADNIGQWTIGQSQNWYTAPVVGFCELRLWDSARTVEAIRSTMLRVVSATPADGHDAELVGSWRLNDAVGVTAVDCTRFGNHAVLWDMTFAKSTRKPVTSSEVLPVIPYSCPTIALRKCVSYTNGECLVVYHGLADWLHGNPGYAGLYQVSGYRLKPCRGHLIIFWAGVWSCRWPAQVRSYRQCHTLFAWHRSLHG